MSEPPAGAGAAAAAAPEKATAASAAPASAATDVVPSGGPAGSRTRSLTRVEKAAVILCLIGEEKARNIFESLGEASLRRFAGAMARLREIDAATVAEVVSEFLTEVDMADRNVRGGLDQARAILAEYFDEPAVDGLLVDRGGDGGRDPWSRLAALPPEPLAELLAREHPQAAAVVMGRLPAEQAGAVMNGMGAETVAAIVLAMRRTGGIDRKREELIASGLAEALRRDGAVGGAGRAPQRVASIMNHADSALRERILGLLEAKDAGFAEATRRSMFTFEDIPARLRPQDAPAVVRSVDAEVLTRALAGPGEAAAAVRAFLLSNISSRLGEQIAYELDEAGEVRPKEAEAARKELVKSIVALDGRREITLADPEDA